MLLTSVAFGVAAVTLARRKVLVQELPAVEGLAPGRRRLPRQDRHAHRGRRSSSTSSSRSAAHRRHDVDAALGALAADENRNATLEAIAGAFAAPDGWARSGGGAVLVGAQVERGDVRRARHVGDRRARDGARRRRRRPARATRRRAGRRAAGACCSLARSDAPLDGEALPPSSSSPPRWCCSRSRCGPTPRRRSRYFAEQGVALKVISGDNPRTVGAVARRVGLPGADDAVRRPRAARGPGGARRDPRGALGVRPGDSAAEAGDGRRAAVARARRRDDRRRRERRARAQGRRHRRGDGFGRGGDPCGGAAGAARRQVRDACPASSPRAGG